MEASTYQYLKPTDKQLENMNILRTAADDYSQVLEAILPAGPDKNFTIRNHRTTAMWANIALTREADGSPRKD